MPTISTIYLSSSHFLSETLLLVNVAATLHNTQCWRKLHLALKPAWWCKFVAGAFQQCARFISSPCWEYYYGCIERASQGWTWNLESFKAAYVTNYHLHSLLILEGRGVVIMQACLCLAMTNSQRSMCTTQHSRHVPAGLSMLLFYALMGIVEGR